MINRVGRFIQNLLTKYQTWACLAGLIFSVIIYFSFIAPAVKILSISNSDKLGHLSAYAAFSLCLYLWSRLRFRKIYLEVLFSIILPLLMGILIEVLQVFSGRNFDLYDIYANAVGLGLSLVAMLINWCRKV